LANPAENFSLTTLHNLKQVKWLSGFCGLFKRQWLTVNMVYLQIQTITSTILKRISCKHSGISCTTDLTVLLTELCSLQFFCEGTDHYMKVMLTLRTDKIFSSTRWDKDYKLRKYQDHSYIVLVLSILAKLTRVLCSMKE
jgi:hypothetical protein